MQSRPFDGINIGDIYERQQSQKRIVKVVSLTVDGFVGLQDKDGMHFVPLQTLQDETYFKKVEDDTDRQAV